MPDMMCFEWHLVRFYCDSMVLPNSEKYIDIAEGANKMIAN